MEAPVARIYLAEDADDPRADEWGVIIEADLPPEGEGKLARVWIQPDVSHREIVTVDGEDHRTETSSAEDLLDLFVRLGIGRVDSRYGFDEDEGLADGVYGVRYWLSWVYSQE